MSEEVETEESEKEEIPEPPQEEIRQIRYSFGMVNIIEIISVCVFVTGGAFLATAWLIGVVTSTPPAGSLQIAMGATGTGLAVIGMFIRWLLSRYG